MNTLEKLCLIYITSGSVKEAKKISQILIEKNLAACVNLIENMTAIYKWRGKIAEENEVVIIVKTRKILVPNLIEAVSKIHSNECACILQLPIQGGSDEFLNWIEKETIDIEESN